MDTNKILSADLLDLVFDDRNKDYGAYELRRTYEKRIKKALIITGTVALLGFSGTLLANKLKPSDNARLRVTEFELADVPDEPLPPPPPPPKAAPPPAPVRTVPLTSIVVVPDEIVDEPVTTQDEALHAQIGLIKIDAPDGDPPLKPSDLDGETGIVATQKTPHEGFTPIEVDAQFKGDWRRFLETTLRPDIGADNGAPPGRYTVMLQFVVDAEGNVSEIKALNTVGYGLEEEAIRTIKKSKKWTPALQNGRYVPTYRKQPITFVIDER
jgi:protein TonB